MVLQLGNIQETEMEICLININLELIKKDGMEQGDQLENYCHSFCIDQQWSN